MYLWIGALIAMLQSVLVVLLIEAKHPGWGGILLGFTSYIIFFVGRLDGAYQALIAIKESYERHDSSDSTT